MKAEQRSSWERNNEEGAGKGGTISGWRNEKKDNRYDPGG